MMGWWRAPTHRGRIEPMKKMPNHPMPLPGAPPPNAPDAPAHQPIDPDDGAPALPLPEEEEAGQPRPPP